MKYSGIGGQAVIEGIMMKNKDEYATAVRKPDGQIEVAKDTYVSLTERVKLFSLYPGGVQLCGFHDLKDENLNVVRRFF